MEYIKDINLIQRIESTSVTVGKFDGIHRGHEYLAKKIVSDAKENHRKSVVVTFDKSPRYTFGSEEEKKLKNLITNDERAMILEHIGVDYLVELPFTNDIISMEPKAFIEFLVQKLGMKYIICGPDFTFGCQGRGNAGVLKEYESELGYKSEVVEKIKDLSRDISSTFIREEIVAGNMEKANLLLGYHYFVYGEIVHGNHIGRKMKMPTINIMPTSDKLLPPNGVYVSNVFIDGVCYNGVTNIGLKPTIEEEEKRMGVETHILDFEGDVYGKVAKVEFLKFLRPEKKFSSMEELSNQIALDTNTAREYFEMLQ